MLSRAIRIGTALVILGLMADSAAAQPGGGGGRGGRGMRGPGGTASEVMSLLAAPEIRKEVKLSDEAYGAIEKLQKENQEAMAAMFRAGRDASDADREKFRTEMTQRNEKAQALLDEVLPPEGLDRLLGLYVQNRGESAVIGELISKKLGLSDADKEKIQTAVSKVRDEAFGQFRQGGAQNQEPAQMRARFEEIQKKTNEAALAAMSDQQKKALEELKGAKFEFPESLRGGAFGGFGRGPGGPGGRAGGRPSSESGT